MDRLIDAVANMQVSRYTGCHRRRAWTVSVPTWRILRAQAVQYVVVGLALACLIAAVMVGA
jgi:hypothetical protein